MAKIKDIVEQRIKDAARITDILEDGLGVQLHRDGVNLQGLCPFHNDKHLGSFKVSETKNICTCFSCGKTWNPVDALMEGMNMDYPTALRWIAAKYCIPVDDEPVPEVKKSEPRPKAKELPMIYWPLEFVKQYMGSRDINPLLQYLYHIPMSSEDRMRFEQMLGLYCVGTSKRGNTSGWTIWWQIDEQYRVRTGKLMKYLPDGHRDKSSYKTFTWVHSMLQTIGAYNPDNNQVSTCLFGQHLTDVFKDAEICLVESEKSALICSAFTDPNERLWMATAGKSGLTRKKLQPLIDRNRYIVIYPDKDGYDEWKAIARMIDYPRMSVSNKVNDLWIMQDGPKADIADIMLRRQNGITETEAEKACRRLGMQHVSETIQYMIDKLNLKLID